MDSWGISLLSPAYLLSVERWPFHSGPPDHYGRLSSLLDSQSRSQANLYLHSTVDFQPTEPTIARLRYSLGATLHETTHREVPGLGLDITDYKGVISRMLPNTGGIGSTAPAYPTVTHNTTATVVKVHGVFPSTAGARIFTGGSVSLVYVGDSGEVVTPFVRVKTYPTRNFATLGPL